MAGRRSGQARLTLGTPLWFWYFPTDGEVVSFLVALQESNFLLDSWLEVVLVINLLILLTAHGGRRGKSWLPAPNEPTVQLVQLVR